MALDQPALLEVLEALKAAEVEERIRQAAETVYQALIEAEMSSVIGAFPHPRTGRARPSTGTARRQTAGPARCWQRVWDAFPTGRLIKRRFVAYSFPLAGRARLVDEHSAQDLSYSTVRHYVARRLVEPLVHVVGLAGGQQPRT
jgi:putative transposase